MIILHAEPTSKREEAREIIILFFIKDLARPIIAEKKMINEEIVMQDTPAFFIESTSEKLCSVLNVVLFEKCDL